MRRFLLNHEAEAGTPQETPYGQDFREMGVEALPDNTYLPYEPVGMIGLLGDFENPMGWPAPVVHVTGYRGEAPLHLQPTPNKPHPWDKFLEGE